MKRRLLGKCLLALSLMVLINVLCLANVSSAEEKNNQNDQIITLSPEQVGEQHKRLKGYRVHTVVWLRAYTFGAPYAQGRKDKDKYEFAIHPNSKEKPEKNRYVEVEATIGGDFLGYIDLNEAEYISYGSQAKTVLDQIDEQERTNKPNIENLILKADQKKHEDEDTALQAEKQQFEVNVESARKNYKPHKNIHTLTPKELKDKHGDYEGDKFHTVLTVNGIHKDYFTAKLKKSDWLDSFYCYFDWDIDLRNHLRKGDVVEITGTIKPGFLNGDDYTSCEIINIGAEAQIVLDSIETSKKAVTNNKQKKDKPKPDNDSEEKTPQARAIESNEQTASEEVSFTSIEKGASGDSVVEIQKQLAVLGFLASSVDGKFGPGTEQAVKDFQNANHIESTGIVDKETYDAIIVAEAAPKEQEKESFTPIKRGDSGDLVVEIQKQLAALGYLTSSADGKFGPATERAVVNFQEANHLSSTGIVDESSYNKLFSSDAVRYVAPVLTPDAEVSNADVGTRSSSDPLVWITASGKRYHSKSNCGRTKSSWQVTLSEARAKGLTPCGNCY